MNALTCNHETPKIDFDFSPFFERLASIKKEATNLKRLYRIYDFLNTFEKYAPYIVVKEKEIHDAEEMIAVIDDIVDEVEEVIGQAPWIKKILLKKILDKLLNIEFVISNKTADHIGENCQNQTL